MFVENAIINFLMLWLASHILNVRIKIIYTVFWSLLMSISSVFVEIITINLGILPHHILYAGIYLIMTNLYFKRLNMKKHIHIISAITLSIAIITGIFAILTGKKYSLIYIIPALFIITLILIRLYEGLQTGKERAENIYNISIGIKDIELELSGYFDTGNMLIDYHTGYPVIILDYRIMQNIVSEQEFEIVEKFHKTGVFNYEEMGKTIHFYPLPYKTISSEISLMPAFKINHICFMDYEFTTKKVIAGISRYKLNNYKDYQVLLNERIKPNREEKFK